MKIRELAGSERGAEKLLHNCRLAVLYPPCVILLQICRLEKELEYPRSLPFAIPRFRSTDVVNLLAKF